MKILFFSFIAASIASVALSQVVVGPARPALQVSPNAAMVPGQALPAATTVNSLTTSTGLVVNVDTLATLLSSLQTVTEQTLPVLANFNDGFDFFSLSSGITANGGLASMGSSFANNTATNFSKNTGQNFGRNLSANVATPTVPPATAATNSFGIPGGIAASMPSRETLRALLVLQNDLERLLPLLTSLNGGTNTLAGPGLSPGFIPGVFTNTFGGTVAGQ